MQPIFRTIEVGTGQHIELTRPLSPDVRALMTPPDPGATQLQMRTGTFGHAASITVTLSPLDMSAERIEFTYDPGTDYATLLADYTEMLGEPSHSGTLPGTNESAVWEDTITRFQLWSRGATAGSKLENTLAD